MFVLTSQNPQRSLFHLLGLACRFVEPRLEVGPSMLPSLVDGGFHVACQDDEFRRAAVVMGAETYDVDLGHSGRKIAKN